MISISRIRFVFAALLVASLISSCGGGRPSGTFVWIDVPLDGLVFPDLQPVSIEGHATGNEGVASVEIFVNGDLWTTISELPTQGSLVSFQSEWMPNSPGEYIIHAVAYGADGTESQYDQTTITFGELEEELDQPEEPIETEEVTQPEEVETVIQFWAEPEIIEAGDCSDLKWHVENVQQVIFGGVDQEFDGSFQTCLCKNERYTLTAIHLDGSEEKQQVDIQVTGTCVDNVAPPAPAQSVPSNGLSIDCKSSQNLVWIPVSDESGISEYRAGVQRHSGDNNWQDIPGSTFTGIQGKQISINVECGWFYRWRVRAVDGANNAGPWSGWWKFTINLE